MRAHREIEIEDGPTLELKAGDIASLPEGTAATWSFSDDYKEMWVLEGAAAAN